MTESAIPGPLMVCPQCGSQAVVELPEWERIGSCVHCGANVPIQNIPEHVVSAVAMHAYRDNDAIETGAVFGALMFGVVVTVFWFFPAVWLTLQLQTSWIFVVDTTVYTIVWICAGAIVGAISLKVLSAILAPSWKSFNGAVRGMVIGFTIGALVGAACVFLRHVFWGNESLSYVWIAYSGRVTVSSVGVGTLFALFGSWIGAMATWQRRMKRQAITSTGSPSSKDARERSTPSDYAVDAALNAPRDRFQFGISPMLLLTAAVALMFAASVQPLAWLNRNERLQDFMLTWRLLMFLLAMLVFPFVFWATFRGPTVYRRLVETLTRCRDLKRNARELK